MLDKKELLDGLFDETGVVGAIEVVGDPSPENFPVRMVVLGWMYVWYMCLFAHPT